MEEHRQERIEQDWNKALEPVSVRVLAGQGTTEITQDFAEAAFVDFGKATGQLPASAYRLIGGSVPQINLPKHPSRMTAEDYAAWEKKRDWVLDRCSADTVERWNRANPDRPYKKETDNDHDQRDLRS